MSSKLKPTINVLHKESNIFMVRSLVAGSFVVDMCWNESLISFRRNVAVKKCASTSDITCHEV